MGKFFKEAGLVALLVVILGFFYFQSSRVFAGGIGIKQTSQSSTGKTAVVQDQEPEGNQRCENKKHPSNGQAPDPNKIACTCQPKCVNGKRQEDPACKRYCKPDTCDCPDPCPKT